MHVITLCQTDKKVENNDCNDIDEWISQISIIIYYLNQDTQFDYLMENQSFILRPDGISSTHGMDINSESPSSSPLKLEDEHSEPKMKNFDQNDGKDAQN